MMVFPGDQFAASGGIIYNGATWIDLKSCKDILFAFSFDSGSDSQPGGTGRRLTGRRAARIDAWDEHNSSD